MGIEYVPALLDLILPRDCAGCGVPGVRFCRFCLEAFESEQCLPPLTEVAGVNLAAAAMYGGTTRSMLIAFKERGAVSLADPLGKALAQALARLPGLDLCRPVWLIPVPSGRGVDRRRGSRPMLELAQASARELRLGGWQVVVCSAAISVRRRLDQVGLSEIERRTNLAGSMAARPIRVPLGTSIVLVDDIATSGATLAELARALRIAGHTPLGAAVVALTSTERHLRTAAGRTNV